MLYHIFEFYSIIIYGLMKTWALSFGGKWIIILFAKMYLFFPISSSYKYFAIFTNWLLHDKLFCSTSSCKEITLLYKCLIHFHLEDLAFSHSFTLVWICLALQLHIIVRYKNNILIMCNSKVSQLLIIE